MNKRTRLVYAVLATVWTIIIVWQVVEHGRVHRAAQVSLINRAKDISTTLGLVLRSQRRFWGVISRERMESVLSALVKPEELSGIALLNAAGEVVASAGAPIDPESKGLVPTGQHWARRSVTLLNLVDLGTNVAAEAEPGRLTIVLPRDQFPSPPGTNRPPPQPPDGERPPPPAGGERPPEGERPPTSTPPPDTTNTSAGAERPPPEFRGPRRGEGRPPFGRPFWMSEQEYKAAIEKKGVHSFVITLSTQPMRAATRRDLLLRMVIGVLASVSVVGLGLAWRNLARTSELELRLVRAAELNTRLKDMNLAAAGLAHETKNPLNIIRGLAQMISKQQQAPEDLRAHSRNIVDEVDRVTAQLNEFINFSRPREVRRATVALGSVVAEVVRALGHDLEEKAIRLQVQEALPTIEADEQLLRQALFNLLLNAIQAVDRDGEIQVTAVRLGAEEAALEIRDNGPGVPPEHRGDIFKPYFTTNAKGTGLGLAVVQQIVTAHGWEIACLANEPRGAAFRLSHLRLAGSG